jgi:pSer/pThr/pTyr-binding forkhead associated (FHA) protein
MNAITIGRGQDCTIKVNEEGLSRKHCSLFMEGDHWKMQDGVGNTTSTNGTW